MVQCLYTVHHRNSLYIFQLLNVHLLSYKVIIASSVIKMMKQIHCILIGAAYYLQRMTVLVNN